MAIFGFAQKHPPHGAARVAGIRHNTVDHLTDVNAKGAELMEQVLLYSCAEGGRLKMGQLRDVVDWLATEQWRVMI